MATAVLRGLPVWRLRYARSDSRASSTGERCPSRTDRSAVSVVPASAKRVPNTGECVNEITDEIAQNVLCVARCFAVSSNWVDAVAKAGVLYFAGRSQSKEPGNERLFVLSGLGFDNGGRDACLRTPRVGWRRDRPMRPPPQGPAAARTAAGHQPRCGPTTTHEAE